MFLNLLHRFGDIPLPTQRPRHGRRPTALRRPTDRHCWPRLTDRRPTPADWPTCRQVESQAPAEGFLGPSVGPTHRKKCFKKASGVYTQKMIIHQKQAPFWCIHPENDYTPKTSTPQTTNFLHFTRCFCLWTKFWCIHPKNAYTPKTKDPRFGVYTPKMIIHQKQGFYIHQKHIYTRKTQKTNLWDAGMFRGGGGPGAWVLGLLVVGRSGRIMSAITDGVPSWASLSCPLHRLVFCFGASDVLFIFWALVYISIF